MHRIAESPGTVAACGVCGLNFKPRRKDAKYCSPRCRNVVAKRFWRDANPAMGNLPTGTTGAMHEMLVAIDLLRRGLYVYRSLTPNAPSDLAVLHGCRLIRVEVTTGYASPAGATWHPKKDGTKFDVLAIVTHDGTISYRPELAELLK